MMSRPDRCRIWVWKRKRQREGLSGVFRRVYYLRELSHRKTNTTQLHRRNIAPPLPPPRRRCTVSSSKKPKIQILRKRNLSFRFFDFVVSLVDRCRRLDLSPQDFEVYGFKKLLRSTNLSVWEFSDKYFSGQNEFIYNFLIKKNVYLDSKEK